MNRQTNPDALFLTRYAPSRHFSCRWLHTARILHSSAFVPRDRRTCAALVADSNSSNKAPSLENMPTLFLFGFLSDRCFLVRGLFWFSSAVTHRRFVTTLFDIFVSMWSTNRFLSGFGMNAFATRTCTLKHLRFPSLYNTTNGCERPSFPRRDAFNMRPFWSRLYTHLSNDLTRPRFETSYSPS